MAPLTAVARKWGIDSEFLAQRLEAKLVTRQPSLEEEQPPIWMEMLADPAFFQLPDDELTEDDKLRRGYAQLAAANFREEHPLEERIDMLQSEVGEADISGTLEESLFRFAEYKARQLMEERLAQVLTPVSGIKLLHQRQLRASGIVSCTCGKFRSVSTDPVIREQELAHHMELVLEELELDSPKEETKPDPAALAPSSGTIQIPILKGGVVDTAKLGKPVLAGSCEHGCVGLARNLACPEHGLGDADAEREVVLPEGEGREPGSSDSDDHHESPQQVADR